MTTHISLEDQIKCIEKELAFRRKIYPVWIERGSLMPEGADIEISRMEAVLNTLKGLQGQTGGLFDQADEQQVMEAIDR